MFNSSKLINKQNMADMTQSENVTDRSSLLEREDKNQRKTRLTPSSSSSSCSSKESKDSLTEQELKTRPKVNPMSEIGSVPPSLITIGVATQQERKKDLKKVTELIDALYDVLYIYGYSDERESLYLDKVGARNKTIRDKLKLRNLYLDFVFRTGFGSWKDLFKYKINAYFSFINKQEVPPPPVGLEQFKSLLDPAFLFFGRAKRFIQILNLNVEKKKSFAQSIAQSKKAAPAVHPEMVEEAERKTFAHLTTPREDVPNFAIYDGVFSHQINRDTMCYQLRRTIRECLGNKTLTWSEVTKPFVPSTSSNYNWDRKNLGAVGAFLSNEEIYKILRPLLGRRDLVKKDLGSVTLSEELSELYGRAGKEEQSLFEGSENPVDKETLALLYDGEELCILWKDQIYPTLIREALGELPRTMVIGLPEPLKVRCITAGPPLTYTALKPVQQWLWRNLKSQSVFQLIGTPVTQDIVKSMMGTLQKLEVFISGDYKASTDNLHSWVSECLLDELVTMFREKVYEPDALNLGQIADFEVLMRRALTGHMIMDPRMNASYRKGNHIRDEDFKEQKEGQLMGSIISFPFLCLANAAMCRWAMEISDKVNYKVVDRHISGYTTARLLINGDDCLFPGRKDGTEVDAFGQSYRVGIFDIWKKVTGFGGLESSVGKTFVSKKFMTINSVQYEYSNETRDWEEDIGGNASDVDFLELKYVNMGLVYAQSKSGERGKNFFTLGSVHEDLKNTCPVELFAKATELFIRNAKERKYRPKLDNNGKPIRKDGRTVYVEEFFKSIKNAGVPWYLPSWLGGLGLQVPNEKDWDDKGSLRALRKYGKIVRDNIESYRPMNYKNFAKWQFHKLVDSSLDEFAFLKNQNFVKITYDETQRVLSDEYQKLYNLCVVERFLLDALVPSNPKSGDRFDKIAKDTPLEEQNQMLTEVFIHNSKMWRHLFRDHSHTQSGLLEVEDLEGESKDFPLSCFDVRQPTHCLINV